MSRVNRKFMQGKVWRYLRANGPTTVSVLRAHYGVNPSIMCKILYRMQVKGCISTSGPHKHTLYAAIGTEPVDDRGFHANCAIGLSVGAAQWRKSLEAANRALGRNVTFPCTQSCSNVIHRGRGSTSGEVPAVPSLAAILLGTGPAA